LKRGFLFDNRRGVTTIGDSPCIGGSLLPFDRALLATCFMLVPLLDLFFNIKYGGDMFLRKVG
jgi:hypothetical protein